MLKNSADFVKNPEKYYYALEKKIESYSFKKEKKLIKRAYYFSFDRHIDQYRESGEPFASHPYAVANILADLKLDPKSIITALLHDTLEDGVATYTEIEENFGAEILELVEGVTKLSKIQLPDSEVREANNFRKFILAICKDIRILIIKLADRLHNMRTIGFVKEQQRKHRISKETLEVYAPLAGRVGFQIMREELEDLAFKEINPIAYESIKKRILFLNDKNKNFVNNIIREIEKIFETDNKILISGREKKIYSTWNKMNKKSISLEKISDIYAFRIITKSKEDCYNALGKIHLKWPMMPQKFKDFISTPKPNGYASIHTSVIGIQGMPMELQIRSEEMHHIAEYGVASHWIYKSHNSFKNKEEINRGTKWFQDVLDIVKTAGGPRELMEYSKMDMYSENVFCFTPKGDVVSLIKGSTVLDFAYSIHTNLGRMTIGAKINGNLTPLNTEVVNGDQIEIISSKGQLPQQSWLNFTRTGKARSQIRKFLRDHEQDEFEKLGKEVLKKILLDINKRATKKVLSLLIKTFNYSSYRAFYIALGRREINSDLILKTIFPSNSAPKDNMHKNIHRLPILGLKKGVAMNLAECCNPLPGENIVGILNEGKGINVHLLNCYTLERFSDFPELWYELVWDEKITNYPHVAQIKLTLQNKVGSINRVTSCAVKLNVNIIDLKINKRSEDFFEIEISIQVSNIKHFNDFLFALKLEETIYKVERI